MLRNDVVKVGTCDLTGGAVLLSCWDDCIDPQSCRMHWGMYREVVIIIVFLFQGDLRKELEAEKGKGSPCWRGLG